MGFKPRKKNPRYLLTVRYSLKHWEWGDLDQPLRNLVGREEEGAGTTLGDTGLSERDLAFYFVTRPAAERAEERVRWHAKRYDWKGIEVDPLQRLGDE